MNKTLFFIHITIIGMDKFYTIPSYSEKCIKKIEEIYGSYSRWRMVVEPSAGNGSFFNQIPTENKLGMDLEPECENILKQNFFDYVPKYTPDNLPILVIGNPPFGRVSSSAIKFFNHAAAWADVIAFIVPRTFRKISVQNKLNTLFHLIYDEEIPISPCHFTPKMMAKCCFQVWEKRIQLRPLILLPTYHEHWEFLSYGPLDDRNQPTQPKGADFAIRAYGGKIGEIRSEDLHLLRPKSWHWIKVNETKINKYTLIKHFRNLDYSKSLNTARQNSMGRAELVNLYTIFLDSMGK